MLVSATAPIRSGRARVAPLDAAARNARAVALLRAARSASPYERRRIHQTVMLDYLDVARAVASRFRHRGGELGDLRQVAYVGLAKAVHRFEPTRGGDIVSFAVPTISGEIKRYLRDTSWVVRPPRRVQELSLELREATESLRGRLGREPSVAELAAEVDRDEPLVREALRCGEDRRPLSLDAPIDDRSDSSDPLIETLSRAESDFERADIALTLTRACRTLSAFERRILYLRFFREQTQSEIAAECGVSQMQVSRLLARILATLRSRIAED